MTLDGTLPDHLPLIRHDGTGPPLAHLEVVLQMGDSLSFGGGPLHRYLAEFAFRYNNHAAHKVSDRERTEKIMEGIWGKRLLYRRIGEAQNA